MEIGTILSILVGIVLLTLVFFGLPYWAYYNYMKKDSFMLVISILLWLVLVVMSTLFLTSFIYS